MKAFAAAFLVFACCAFQDKKDADPVGVWEGALKVQSIELRLVFNIKLKDGKFLATMDSPDQGVKDIAVEKVAVDGRKLTIDMPSMKASFAGEFAEDGKSIKGTWKQSGEHAMTFKKVDRATELVRPQTPKPPFPYKDEDVTVANPKAEGVKLAGTLTIPEGKGPFPAVILISGSGAQDRDETLLGHKPFWIIADHLARNGIAVLRFDDRGVAKSTGDHSKATSADFATDVEALFDYLKNRKEVDPKRIGLAGHSEGGLIAPMVAAVKPDMGFIILLAGPGLPGRDIIVLQSALIQKQMGVAEDIRKWNGGLQLKLFDALKANADKEAVAKIVDAEVEKMPALAKLVMNEKKRDELKTSIKMFESPWFRYFLEYDPRPTLRKVKCPVLALNGELDLQVPFKENLEAIGTELFAGEATKFEIRQFPGLNHLFQTTKTGLPSEYGKIEETFNIEVLKAMSDWIKGLK